jgi:hypothetical protein
MFAPWWIAKLFYSFLSFTLLVFTIPLAFDVGGRDCGLVPNERVHRLIIDVFLGSSDVLFLFIVITVRITTFAITMVALCPGIFPNSHYPDDFGFCVECFYYQFYTIIMDSPNHHHTMGLDVD